MTAAVATCDVVQILQEEVNELNRGTRSGLVTYFFKFTKAADEDWLVTTSEFQTGIPLMWTACTVDTDGVQEDTVGITYADTGDLLTFNGGTTGTVYGTITFAEVDA